MRRIKGTTQATKRPENTTLVGLKREEVLVDFLGILNHMDSREILMKRGGLKNIAGNCTLAVSVVIDNQQLDIMLTAVFQNMIYAMK